MHQSCFQALYSVHCLHCDSLYYLYTMQSNAVDCPTLVPRSCMVVYRRGLVTCPGNITSKIVFSSKIIRRNYLLADKALSQLVHSKGGARQMSPFAPHKWSSVGASLNDPHSMCVCCEQNVVMGRLLNWACHPGWHHCTYCVGNVQCIFNRSYSVILYSTLYWLHNHGACRKGMEALLTCK